MRPSNHSNPHTRWWVRLTPDQRAELEAKARERRVANLNKMLSEAVLLARLKKARTKRTVRIAKRRATLSLPPLSTI